jgi:hypothetical protein
MNEISVGDMIIISNSGCFTPAKDIIPGYYIVVAVENGGALELDRCPWKPRRTSNSISNIYECSSPDAANRHRNLYYWKV